MFKKLILVLLVLVATLSSKELNKLSDNEIKSDETTKTYLQLEIQEEKNNSDKIEIKSNNITMDDEPLDSYLK